MKQVWIWDEHIAHIDDVAERYASERTDIKEAEDTDQWEHDYLNKIYLRHLELSKQYI